MKLKKALSTLLAAAMACSLLAVPASAAGTTETVKGYGCDVTITNVVRTVTQTCKFNMFYDPNDTANDGIYDTAERGAELQEITIYVVELGAEITYTPSTEVYYTECTFQWIAEDRQFSGCRVSKAYLAEPQTTSYDYVYVPWYGHEEEPNYHALRSYDGVFITSEEELALYLPYDGSGTPTQPAQPQQPSTPVEPTQPVTPVQPEQPAVPAAAGTYTVKPGDSWSSICINFYGSNAQRTALQRANKGVKFQAGAVVTLPDKLGNVARIPAPSAGAGEKLYTVQAGDTLGKIAAAEYGQTALYKAIFERNADRLKNANTIYEGQVIVLPAKG